MLRQISRRGRLEALLQDKQDEASQNLAPILAPENLSGGGPPGVLKPSETAKFFTKALMLPDADYDALVNYLQFTGRPYRHWKNLPYPPNPRILPTRAEFPPQVSQNGHTYSCERSHRGNSAIYFYNPLTQQYRTGFIQSIWRLPLEGSISTFIVVQPHRSLPPQEETKAPFLQYSGFRAQIFDQQPSNELVIIEPTHIITHLTTFKRPAGTYGINGHTLVVCWALDRGKMHQ